MTRAAVPAVRMVLKDPSQVQLGRSQCYTGVESDKHGVRAALCEGPSFVDYARSVDLHFSNTASYDASDISVA